MSKRTRYFLIGAVAFLVLGLSIGTVAYYNGGFRGLGRASGPDELRYVPENAVVVAFANVQQIMNSDFRRRIKELEAGKGERGQEEFREQTGIDIERDIDTVVAYMTAPGEGENSQTSGVVMAAGRFDRNRIESLVSQKGGAVSDYKGRRFMTFGSGHPGRAGALAFLSDHEVAVGSADAVRRTVDLSVDPASAGPDVRQNEKMRDLIDAVGNGNAWVVGRFDAISKGHLPQQVKGQIPPISWFSASGTINGGVAGKLSVEAEDPKAAENLMQVVQGLKGLAALQARSNNVPTGLQQTLDSLQISRGGRDNNVLTLSFTVPSDVLNGLVHGKVRK